MKHIIGLGNPDKKYEKTRHNIGWMVLDVLARDLEWQHSKKGETLYAWTERNNEEIELLKPTTYMNNSGKTLAYVVKKHPKTKPEDIIVVHDEVDIPFGSIKISHNASSAGHNGVQSLIESIGSKDFYRVRIGIGKSDTMPTEQYVLQTFTPDEQKNLEHIINQAVTNIYTLLDQDVTTAQN